MTNEKYLVLNNIMKKLENHNTYLEEELPNTKEDLFYIRKTIYHKYKGPIINSLIPDNLKLSNAKTKYITLDIQSMSVLAELNLLLC